MKLLKRTIDHFVLIIYGLLFVYHLVFGAIFEIKIHKLLSVAGNSFGVPIAYLLVIILLSMVTPKDIFTSFKPFEFTKSFRLVMIVQLLIQVCVMIDYHRLPDHYENFTRLPLRYHLINSGPIFLWAIRTVFRRLVFIENELKAK